MTNTEKRAALQEVATQLQTELTAIREAIRPLSQLVADLIARADALMLASADEITAGTEVTIKRIVHVPKEDVQQKRTEAEVVAGPIWSGAKRKCSVCRKPGHRAQNCPDAHKVQEAKKAEVAARPKKRVGKPVSAERRTQLAEQLKRARAARKGKK